MKIIEIINYILIVMCFIACLLSVFMQHRKIKLISSIIMFILAIILVVVDRLI